MRRALALLALSLTAAGCSGGGATGAASSPTAPSPAPTPTGAPLRACTPPPEHPVPVVLVHGTFGTAGGNWRSLAPVLRRAGYCVYALNYGFGGLQAIERSAGQLDRFVREVLAVTGARRVSLVGHSQGGLMPRYWLKAYPAGGLVDDFVALAPPNHGTTSEVVRDPPGFCAACVEMRAGSPFLRALNRGGETVPGVDYTVLATRYDRTVLPYTSAFLHGPRVSNVTVQTACPRDRVTHAGLAYDPVVAQWVLEALARPGPADPAFRPRC